MSSNIQNISTLLTLQPATPQSLVINLDPKSIGGHIGIYLTLENGANPINTILWERSADGVKYVTDSGYASSVGTSLAAGTKASLDDFGISSRYLRITFTSTLGTTCELRARVTSS